MTEVDDSDIDHLVGLPKNSRLEFLESMDILGQAVEFAWRAAEQRSGE